MTQFQSAAGWQGRQFAQQCDFLLTSNGYELRGRQVFRELGVEIDQVCVSRRGTLMWVEYKGSFQGTRPGFLRTDTVKKAVANGALLRAIDEHPPFIVLTSHVPQKGAAFSMMTIAKDLGYIDDVICVNDPADVRRLAQL